MQKKNYTKNVCLVFIYYVLSIRFRTMTYILLKMFLKYFENFFIWFSLIYKDGLFETSKIQKQTIKE